MSSIKQTLLNAGINIFAVDLLCESLLRQKWVADLHKKGESLRFFHSVNRTDCAGWVGVAISLRPVGEFDVIPSVQATDFIDAAVKAERERVWDPILDELLKAIRRVYDDVGPPGEFGYNTRIGKALKNLYDVFNKALRTVPVPPKLESASVPKGCGWNGCGKTDASGTVHDCAYPDCVAEKNFELRGKLASSLSFWHRLTENEAAELVTLLAVETQPAPSAKPPPFTDAQLYRLWNNSPEFAKDVMSCAAFKRIVRLTEAAHGMAVKS